MDDPSSWVPSRPSHDALERITLQMASSLDLQVVLTTITQGLVDELDGAFARIWLLGPGDLCADCHKAADCTNRARCLHLKASAGLYTDLNGEYRRIPLGALKIGKIAQGFGPMQTNDVLGDDRLPNKQWMKDNGLQSFAGYPLVFRGDVLGVIAMFGRRPLSDEEFERLDIFANQAAVAIKNAQLFTEVAQLKTRLEAENLYLREEVKSQNNFEEIIGDSPSIMTVLRQIEQVAPTDSTVLLRGDTGTGKELMARAIHNLSPRKARSLVKVNCGAIPANLVESELFGHEKGSFTGALQRRIGRFELADGGTIFLDEVGELPLDAQVKLLRVLQEREIERIGSGHSIKVDVRVIAATNRDLYAAVKAGSFRADLLYRLNVFPIEVPSLSARALDIPLLVNRFVGKFSGKIGKKIDGVSESTMERLMKYAWPGNIRELENVIERATILSKGPLLQIDDVMLQGNSGPLLPIADSLEEVERGHILRILQNVDWVIEGKQGAAARLGLHPNTLRSRMQKLGIKKPRPTA
ncbi:MAG: sigma 54-interacting transcriptional regulator [Nitrospira sp.]|nr:sigma 54-interacting transcriptional regulator [Nitrospira sp.]MDH5496330.1 sigma 54-interacting transcriptional regulator [Nitrospira sp.]MDH5723858.1 sigma 54-interacting transcriptional regulator [Nitrospira sp.]